MKVKQLIKHLKERYKDNDNIYMVLNVEDLKDYYFFSEEDLINLAQQYSAEINKHYTVVEDIEKALNIIQLYADDVEVIEL